MTIKRKIFYWILRYLPHEKLFFVAWTDVRPGVREVVNTSIQKWQDSKNSDSDHVACHCGHLIASGGG